VNVLGTTNVLEAARRHGVGGPVVYASSIAVYGPEGTLAGDDVPGTLYGVLKRTNEGTAVRYFEDYGLASVGLRPHTVFGPGRDQGLTSAPTLAMVAAAAHAPYEIPFGGRMQLQHTADVGEAFARAALLDYEGTAVYDLDGDVLAVEEIVALIQEAVPAAQITVGAVRLPLIAEVDGTGFVALLGGSVMGPAAERIPESVRAFADLIARGVVAAP
jgi:nucleoside-diphosphate-sugar epimerase